MLPGREGHRRGSAERRPGVTSPTRSRSPGRSSGEAEEQAVLEVLRSGQLSLGPRVPAFEEAFAARLGAPPRQRGLVRHRRPAPRAAGGRRRPTATRSSRRRSRSSPRANVIALRARAAGVRRHRPGHAQPRPGRRGRGDHRPHDRAAAGPHLRLPGRHPGVRAHRRCRSSRTPARRSARCTPTASPVGGRGHPAAFGFYANKQLTTGEGGMLTLGSDEHKVTIDSERNQGRAPDMGWLDHDRLGFNYRLSDLACAIGLAQLERLDGMLADRARVAGWYREALAELAAERGPRAAVRGRGRRPPRLVRLRRPAPARGRPRPRRSARCASSACRASRTCPPST